MALSSRYVLFTVIVIALLASHAQAFGAGNIASISSVEGKNWRHGDIEDMLKTVSFLKHHKWTSMMIKRVYFGNWLRDYSQAVDVATLKGAPKDTIRILVWVLSFMSFGYATAEFEVTEERLGTYRPEEHIDNPRDYADNEDARQYDPRLRPPVRPIELEIDPRTGMKNYIANDQGDWATSLAYVKFSFSRAIHYGRIYASQSGMFSSGNEADLCEALRCLGQGLHCLEDFGAHTNYVELCLREMGMHNVFPHTGVNTGINLNGKQTFPLVTGTFGGVDFLHSVLGEATDHVTQSEVDQMNKALNDASSTNQRGMSSPEQEVSGLTDLLAKIPGTQDLCREAVDLQRASDAQADQNYGSSRAGPQFAPSPTFDPQVTVKKIYPILEFRDKVVRAISAVVSKIPGLESLIEKIQERITLFIMGLLAPYITPLITAASQQLKIGSTTVVDASGKHQYEVWQNPHCSDPTHSLLSKDHFSNILNQPAGLVASEILQYVAPRVIYAMDHTDVPVEQVMADVAQVFHHPAARNHHSEVQNKMWGAVEKWVRSKPDRGQKLDQQLSSESVKAGHNHTTGQNPHGHGAAGLDSKIFGLGSHSKVSGSPFDMLGMKREVPMDETFLGSSTGPPVGVQASPYGQNPPYHAETSGLPPQPQYQQPPPQYPTDYTPHDPTTYSTSYNQGFSSPYPAQDQSAYAPPPQPPYQSTGFEDNPYPAQQGFAGGASAPGYDDNSYPPQQGFSDGQYPPQQQYRYGNQPPDQVYDPNNPYPQQQGFGGGY